MAGGVIARPPIVIDIAVETEGWPGEDVLDALAMRAVSAAMDELLIDAGRTELSLVFTGDKQVRALNKQWRGQDKATNVLSFPASPTVSGNGLPPMLGDVVFARETILREAELEGKSFDHHLTHLIVHGFLHLLGHDHETDDKAEEMEGVERRVLAALAIADPYAVTRSGD